MFRICEFTANDLQPVHSLIISQVNTSYAKYHSREVVEYYREYHSQANILKDAASGQCFVAREDAEIVGVVFLVGDYIKSVFVSGSCQGRRVGTLLMESLIANAKQKGYDYVRLDATPGSWKFYLKLGFETTGRKFMPVAGRKRLCYYPMRKNIL